MTVWTPDERQSRWKRSIAAKEAAGFPVEQDPRFLAWIEEWIAGAIPMSEVQRRYGDLLSKGNLPTSNIDSTTNVILDSVGTEIPEMVGVALTKLED